MRLYNRQSLSARRAWIETILRGEGLILSGVALRKESVDRNSTISSTFKRDFDVALRKESVDRNSDCPATVYWVWSSLSARRAWIETALRTYA